MKTFEITLSSPFPAFIGPDFRGSLSSFFPFPKRCEWTFSFDKAEPEYGLNVLDLACIANFCPVGSSFYYRFKRKHGARHL
jgi:hypothetical protein